MEEKVDMSVGMTTGERERASDTNKGNNVLENILNISKRKIQLKPNEATLETNCFF